MVSRNGKVHYSAGSFVLLTLTKSGRPGEIRWSVCISKSQRILFVSFSRTDFELCIYHLFVWSKLNFLHNSQWMTLPTQLCLVFAQAYCICLLCDWSFHLYHHIIIIIIIIIIISSSFSHQLLLTFHWSLNDSKSLQVSRILLSILADFNNSVVWMVSILLLISSSSSLLSSPFETVPRTQAKIGIIVTSVFHNFFPATWHGFGIFPAFSYSLFSQYGPLEQQDPLDDKIFLKNRTRSGLLTSI